MLDESGKLSPRMGAALALLLISCAFVSAGIVLLTRREEPQRSERPACVTLPLYSSVIEQIMGVIPNWSGLRAAGDGFESTWAIGAEGATHRLTARLTQDQCICATLATSHYPNGSPRAEFAGQLLGAAVAPLSDLEYGSSWLQPKIVVNCSLASLRREPYASSETMPDGTGWRLGCGRPAAPAYADLELSLSVNTPQCQDPIQ